MEINERIQTAQWLPLAEIKPVQHLPRNDAERANKRQKADELGRYEEKSGYFPRGGLVVDDFNIRHHPTR